MPAVMENRSEELESGLRQTSHMSKRHKIGTIGERVRVLSELTNNQQMRVVGLIENAKDELKHEPTNFLPEKPLPLLHSCIPLLRPPLLSPTSSEESFTSCLEYPSPFSERSLETTPDTGVEALFAYELSRCSVNLDAEPARKAWVLSLLLEVTDPLTLDLACHFAAHFERIRKDYNGGDIGVDIIEVMHDYCRYGNHELKCFMESYILGPDLLHSFGLEEFSGWEDEDCLYDGYGGYEGNSGDLGSYQDENGEEEKASSIFKGGSRDGTRFRGVG